MMRLLLVIRMLRISYSLMVSGICLQLLDLVVNSCMLVIVTS